MRITILVLVASTVLFSGVQTSSAPPGSKVLGPDLAVYTWPGSVSMMPTIQPGEKFVMDKNFYKLHPISRGNLVAIMVPGYPDVWQVKRVVGIEGDMVEIINGVLYLNGATEDTSSYTITSFTSLNQNPGTPNLFNQPMVHVPKDQVYVLGDHRPAAADSRIWGPLSIKSVVGKPIIIRWSPDSIRIGKKLQ